MKTINGTKGTSAMNRGVLLPKISDFWDSTKDAIPRFAAKLEALSPELAEEMTNMIREAVTEHVRVLPDRWLHLAAFIAAEDLYRTASAITAWTTSVADYLACSAGTFFRILSQRGCHLHYVIDNSFQKMQRPLELFPLWFPACGIHYECPQLLESSGTPPCGSRGLATQHLREAFAAGRHYLFLDTDSTDSSFEAPIEQLGTQGVMTIIRNEAPGPGSGARIYLSGKPLAWEACQSHPSTMKTFANYANSGDEQLGSITCSANTTMTHQPTLVLILGGPAAGKTRFRRQRYSAGHVTIDAGEIFLFFPESKYCAEFPGPLEKELNMIGHDIAKKAIERRYDIVTEMIGEVPDDIAAVSAAMRKAGYRIQAECLTCDIAVAQERNLQRGPDNISAYFTQHFHQKWLIAAANEFSRTQ